MGMSKGPLGFSPNNNEDDDVTYDDKWVEGESIVPLYIQDIPDRSDDDFSEGYAEDF
jgi:hypothetical protein